MPLAPNRTEGQVGNKLQIIGKESGCRALSNLAKLSAMTPSEWLTKMYPREAPKANEFPFDLHAFCKDAKLPYLTVYRHLNGVRTRPQWEVVLAFHEMSGGAIGISEWADLFPGPKRKKRKA